jgi:eukaryotic-like serine/threonine-protein kinase
MPSDRGIEIREVFEAALATPDEERPRFLEQSCAGKPELRAEVDSLLEAGVHVDEFLEHPPVADWSAIPDLMITHSVIGYRLGPYRITRAIGRGGLAAVYEAIRVDGQFEHRVAVKMVMPGLLPKAASRTFSCRAVDFSGFAPSEYRAVTRWRHERWRAVLHFGTG